MDDKLGDRKLYLPRGRDPREDLCCLADTIAGSEAGLFNENETPIWIAAGERVMVGLAALRKICTRYLVTRHQRKTADGWEVEYRPHEPDEMTLRALIGARDWQDGSSDCRKHRARRSGCRRSGRTRRCSGCGRARAQNALPVPAASTSRRSGGWRASSWVAACNSFCSQHSPAGPIEGRAHGPIRTGPPACPGSRRAIRIAQRPAWRNERAPSR